MLFLKKVALKSTLNRFVTIDSAMILEVLICIGSTPSAMEQKQNFYDIANESQSFISGITFSLTRKPSVILLLNKTTKDFIFPQVNHQVGTFHW